MDSLYDSDFKHLITSILKAIPNNIKQRLKCSNITGIEDETGDYVNAGCRPKISTSTTHDPRVFSF